MIRLPIFPGRLPLAFVALSFSLTGALSAAPLPEVAALVGEWSGESARTAAGEPAGGTFADARRYWVEGEMVRGEIIVRAGNDLNVHHVAIVPRGARLLKILTPDGGPPEYFSGRPAEGGVLWTRAGAEGARFIERVAQVDGKRQLQVLLPSSSGNAAETWQVADALPSAQSALTGVIGDAAPAAELVQPVSFPTPSELELYDRVAELIEQRDNARRNIDSLARELATAWQELEGRGALLRTASAELAAAQTALKSGSDDAALAAANERATVAEKKATEVQAWAAGLETSLRSANTRSDESQAKLAALESEVAQLQAGRADLARSSEEAVRLQALVTGMEQQIAEDAKTRAALEAELEGTRSELVAFANQKSELEGRLAGQPDGAAQLDALNKRLADSESGRFRAREELAAAQTRVAALEEELSAARTAAGSAQEIAGSLAGARDALARATAETVAAGNAITDLRGQVNALTAQKHQLEEQLQAADSESASRSDIETRAAEVEEARAALVRELAEARERTASLEQQIAEAGSARRESASQLADARAAGTRLEARITELTSANEFLSGQLRTASETPKDDAALHRRLEDAEEQATRASAELAATRAENVELETRVAALEGEKRTLEEAAQTAQAETGLQQRIEELEATANAASERRDLLERELNTTKASLALMEQRNADQQEALAEARGHVTRGGEQSAQIEADLAASRAHARNLEGELASLRDQLGALQLEKSALASRPGQRPEPAPPDARVIELESRLADTYARAESRQVENDELKQRVASLENLRQSLESRLAGATRLVTASPPAAASTVSAEELDQVYRNLRESETARRELASRNEELATRLSEIEVRLAGAAADRGQQPAPVAPLRTAIATPTVAQAVPPATLPAADDGRITFRMPPNQTPPQVRAAPTRPAEVAATVAASPRAAATTTPAVRGGSNALLSQTVLSLPINGFRRAGSGSIVVVSGRPYRVGDMVDAGRGLRFVGIEAGAIVFAGPDGGEYRRRL